MARRVFALRASEEELAAWKAAADRKGWPVGLWIRQACNEEVALDRAEAQELNEGLRAWGAVVSDLSAFKGPDPRK